MEKLGLKDEPLSVVTEGEIVLLTYSRRMLKLKNLMQNRI